MAVFDRIIGVSSATALTVGLAVLADAFPSEKVGSAIGIANGCSSLGYLVGSVISGIIPRYFSLNVTFYVCSGIAVLDLLGRMLVIIPVREIRPRENSLSLEVSMTSPTQKRTPILTLICNQDIILMGFSIFLSSFSFSSLESLISDVVKTNFHSGSEESSEAFLSLMIPSVLFSFIGGYLCDHWNRYRIALLGAVLFCPAPFLLSLCSKMYFFCICVGYFGATNALLGVSAIPEMTDIVDRLGCSSYARVYSLVNIYYAAGMLVGPIITTSVEHRPVSGFRDAMLILSYLCIPFIVWCAIRVLCPIRCCNKSNM